MILCDLQWECLAGLGNIAVPYMLITITTMPQPDSLIHADSLNDTQHISKCCTVPIVYSNSTGDSTEVNRWYTEIWKQRKMFSPQEWSSIIAQRRTEKINTQLHQCCLGVTLQTLEQLSTKGRCWNWSVVDKKTCHLNYSWEKLNYCKRDEACKLTVSPAPFLFWWSLPKNSQNIANKVFANYCLILTPKIMHIKNGL